MVSKSLRLIMASLYPIRPWAGKVSDEE